MNFLPLYRGAAGATVATLALVVVMVRAAEQHKKAVEERKTVELLSRNSTEGLKKVLEWDRRQFVRRDEIVLRAVNTALQGEAKNMALREPEDPKATVMALRGSKGSHTRIVRVGFWKQKQNRSSHCWSITMIW